MGSESGSNELGAVSADHLECVSPAGIAALAKSGTVAVSLPLASLYLNHAPLPARRLIEARDYRAADMLLSWAAAHGNREAAELLAR